MMDPNSSHPPNWDNKLRLMCSYGGHILPRPHDRSLVYVGGHTRIVVVDRHSSLSDLHSRLSLTLLNARPFTLKYQLPTQDLDSLISLSTDEDLENMIDEYDRQPPSRLRLRLFLFPANPETAASMGSLLNDAKSQTWFVDVLNGCDRGLSDSAAMDTVLEANTSAHYHLHQIDPSSSKHVGDNHIVVDSHSPPLMETTSSFGSTSWSPSMVPIKVRVEDYGRVGLDEELSRGDDAGGVRKPPLPLSVQRKQVVDIHNLASPDSKRSGGYKLASPDSVASDSSITSAGTGCVAKNIMDGKRVMDDQKGNEEEVNVGGGVRNGHHHQQPYYYEEEQVVERGGYPGWLYLQSSSDSYDDGGTRMVATPIPIMNANYGISKVLVQDAAGLGLGLGQGQVYMSNVVSGGYTHHHHQLHHPNPNPILQPDEVVYYPTLTPTPTTAHHHTINPLMLSHSLTPLPHHHHIPPIPTPSPSSHTPTPTPTTTTST